MWWRPGKVVPARKYKPAPDAGSKPRNRNKNTRYVSDAKLPYPKPYAPTDYGTAATAAWPNPRPARLDRRRCQPDAAQPVLTWQKIQTAQPLPATLP